MHPAEPPGTPRRNPVRPQQTHADKAPRCNFYVKTSAFPIKLRRRSDFFANFDSHGRTLLPHPLLQAHLRLLRLLQERRNGAAPGDAAGDAPRAGEPPEVPRRRGGPHALLRRRHPVALHAGAAAGAARPCSRAVRLLGHGGDHARGQPRLPHSPLPRRPARGGHRSASSRSTTTACA